MKNRVEQLDGLRGIFSVMVIAHHHNAFKQSIFYNNFFVINSSLFVDFFFVLSGFVISMNYWNRIESVKDFGQFLKKRFIRLYPLLLYTEIVFILFNFLGNFSPMKNAADTSLDYYLVTARDTLTFMGSTPIFGTWISNNYPAWSISAEMIAYLVFGLISLTFRSLKVYAFGLVILMSAAFIVMHGEYLLAYDYGFVRGLLCFNVGIFTFLFLRSRSKDLSVWEIPFLVLLVGAMYVAHHAEFNLLKLIFPVIFSVGIIIFANSTGMVSRLLSSGPFQYLGRISYSIYLNHAIVLIMINVLLFRYLKLQPTDFKVALSLITSIALTIAYSHFTYEFVEKRAGKFLSSKWK
jgi:peptidoglycan/LPS O-acetylase OafA/YrhL